MGAMQQMLLMSRSGPLPPPPHTIPSTLPSQTQNIVSTRTASPAGVFADAGIIFRPNGTVETFIRAANGSAVFTPYNWALPTTTGIGNWYWARATGGPAVSGNTLNVWHPLSSVVNWSVSFNAGPNQTGTNQRNLFIELSSSATGSPVVSSGNVFLLAQVTL